MNSTGTTASAPSHPQPASPWTPPYGTVRLPRRRGGRDEVTVSVAGMTARAGLEAGETIVMDAGGREHNVYRGVCSCVRNAKLSVCEHAWIALEYREATTALAVERAMRLHVRRVELAETAAITPALERALRAVPTGTTLLALPEAELARLEAGLAAAAEGPAA